MRVEVIVQQLCARVPGGTGRYTGELVRALAAAAPPEAVLTGLAATRCPALEAIPVPTHHLGVDQRLLGLLWERGMGPRAGSNVDLVHAPTLLVPPTPRRARLVVTIHDVVPWTHPQTLTSRGVRFHQRMGARAARAASVIVTPTHAVADHVRQILAPTGQVVPVPMGARPATVPADAERQRQRLGLPDRYLLFVGTAEPRKGLDILVPALTHPDLADLSLVVVGPQGWGDIRVADLAAAAGVGDRVHVVGAVSDPELACIYAGAQALAMPSRAEGFGLPVIEAMAHGVPVVVSADPALVEVAGGAAVVTPIGDVEALAAGLRRAVDAGRQLRDNGRDRAAEFTWGRTAERTWAAYRQACA